MSDIAPLLKKRGRKPKNKPIDKTENPVLQSEEEQIIAHLPISLEDIINSSPNTNTTNDDIFIKSEAELKIPSKKENHLNNDEEIIKKINQKIIETEKIFMFGKSINKVNVHNIKFSETTKCYWCKHTFETPSVELPEDYYNNIFYCEGNYCSWNCAKAYNIDLNDTSTWKRESLLNLMFYKSYGIFKEIIPAPSWLMLSDYGGNLSINEFRNLFLVNNKDYVVLHPPLITRQLQIEESYKKSSNKVDNSYDSELVLKRTKPIESTSLNLEKTMGIKRKVKKFEIK